MDADRRQVMGFFVAARRGELPVAVQGTITSVPISNEYGTFLARSSNHRSRAIASLMAIDSLYRHSNRS